jgi:hypothetical protein
MKCVEVMAMRGSVNLSRNNKTPIQSGAGIEQQVLQSRALFARSDGLVEQFPDFLASDIARATGPAQSVAHFVWLRSKEFPLQGVKQRR